MSKRTKEAKQSKEMSMWMIIFIVIAAVYILSFIIPAGEFQREGKNAIPGTYHFLEKVYLSPVHVIMGVADTAYKSFGALMISILIIGGMMGVVSSTGAIDTFLNTLIVKFKDKALLIIPCFIFAMGFFGCLGSMISTAILFIPLGLSVARQLKVDRKFAVALIIMGSYVGFMTSPVNTLTTILAQGIAGLEPYSGAGLRTVVTLIDLALVSVYLMWYAKKVSRTDKWKEDFAEEIAADKETEVRALTIRDGIVLCIFLGSFVLFAIGAPIFGFTTLKLGSIMLPIGIVCGLIYGYDLDTTMKNFVNGSKGMVNVLVFMILASTMTYILNESLILDSIVYYFSLPLNALAIRWRQSECS